MGWTSIKNVELYFCVPRRFQGVAPWNRKKSMRMYMKNVCNSFTFYARLYLLVTDTSNRLLYILCSAYQVIIRRLWPKVKDLKIFGRSMTQAGLSPRRHWFYWGRLCGICDGQTGTWTSHSPRSSVFLCHCHVTDVPLSFIRHRRCIFLATDSVVKQRSIKYVVISN